MSRPTVSVVVVAFEMERELPRTLFTLRPPYQWGIKAEEIEIIVVDNGSTNPVAVDDHLASRVRVLRIDDASPSPAAAINRGLAAAHAELVGVMVDGARMASPQLLRLASDAASIHERPIIASMGFHLGQEKQQTSVPAGYNDAVEDALLGSVPWQENGYSLFEISVFSGSSAKGWFAPISESNAIFMPRALWAELNGVDERFVALGGGLMNLDLYARACGLPNSRLISLLGEGTFHQVHGGISTNQQRADANWRVFHDEYVAIRGRDFRVPKRPVLQLGGLRQEHRRSLDHSMGHLR